MVVGGQSPPYETASPIARVRAAINPSIETRVRPGYGCRAQTVLDGVVVNVIEVICEIGFVANQVFPESFLPAGHRHQSGLFTQGFCESSLDHPQTGGECCVAFGKRPDRMQVVGKNDDRIGGVRLDVADFSKNASEQGDVPGFGKYRLPRVRNDGEEISGARSFDAAVVGHSVASCRDL